ncbi:MAG: hypothetical protein LQ352_006523 [Teloschistes flavicans]|nr:MAG: hypothetical protein LQ352_006523 [Teloschistes flavicans]
MSFLRLLWTYAITSPGLIALQRFDRRQTLARPLSYVIGSSTLAVSLKEVYSPVLVTRILHGEHPSIRIIGDTPPLLFELEFSLYAQKIIVCVCGRRKCSFIPPESHGNITTWSILASGKLESQLGFVSSDQLSQAEPSQERIGYTNGRQCECTRVLGKRKHVKSVCLWAGQQHVRYQRYIERVQAAHEAKLAAQREAPQTHNTGTGALSSRSSSVSLPKLAPSHRGMTYEVIEHQPPEVHDGWSPLPSKWAETDKDPAMAIGEDGLEVHFIGGSKLHDHEAAAIRTDYPMPAQGGIYYYEVTIVSKGKDGMIGIGFSGPKVSLEKLPGWEPESWGWHGDDGLSFSCQIIGKKYGPTFTTGDVIGCGINFMTGCAFFTKNGNHQGTAFRELKDLNVYPSVGMGRPNAQVTVNFGQREFVYDIDDLIRRERAAINEEIKATDSSQGDENAFLKELVKQLFDHDGFIDTAKAFHEEVQAESRALQIGTEAPSISTPAEEDLDASNRQRK